MADKNKLKRIWVPYGVGRKIAKIFGCSVIMVSLSLNGAKDTKLAKKIRHVALTQYGGKEIN